MSAPSLTTSDFEAVPRHDLRGPQASGPCPASEADWFDWFRLPGCRDRVQPLHRPVGDEVIAFFLKKLDTSSLLSFWGLYSYRERDKGAFPGAPRAPWKQWLTRVFARKDEVGSQALGHRQGLSAARTQKGFHGVAGSPFAESVRRKLVLSVRITFTNLPENLQILVN